MMLGAKALTMMPTDCSVRCTPTILPIIRISWDSHPTFRLILGGGSQGLSSTYEQAHVDLDLLTLASYNYIIRSREIWSREREDRFR